MFKDWIDMTETWDIYVQVYLPCHDPNDPNVDVFIEHAEGLGFELVYDKGIVRDSTGDESYFMGFNHPTNIPVTGRVIEGGDRDETCWEPDYPEENIRDWSDGL